MLLVDTSVWVDHLRRKNLALAERLVRAVVWSHPFVIGELACGRLTRRREVLGLLAALPQAPIATHEEAMEFVEANHLAGSGIGWVDVHLLTSTRLAHVQLWTLDARLAAIADTLGASFRP